MTALDDVWAHAPFILPDRERVGHLLYTTLLIVLHRGMGTQRVRAENHAVPEDGFRLSPL